MKNILSTLVFISSLLLLQAPPIQAQDGSSLPTAREEKENEKVRLNGLGRTIVQQTKLGGPVLDNSPDGVERLTDGEFLLDLAINATPNANTEVQAVLRLRNELGGFFGAGQSIEIRELWARGLIANVLKYRVGDIDMVMTPFTLFNPEEEGMVNGPAIFDPQREVIYYEQFYGNQNERRLQGLKLDMGLNFSKVLESADFTGFLTRIRSADFFNTPTRFVGGGSIDLFSQNYSDTTGLRGEVGLNFAYTGDDLSLGEANSGIRNGVFTLDFDVTLLENENWALHALGELGRSNLEVLEDSISVSEEDDTFMEAGFAFDLKKQNLRLSASFVDVGPDFFSIGAQSKRVDFNRSKAYFNRIGRDNMVRSPGLFDLTRDRALYTFQLSDRLMEYDPRLSNASPYGKATPNRRGVRLGLDWKPGHGKYEVGINAAMLEEIRGQGTPELKSFTLIRPMANVNFHKMAGWKKKLRLTLGAQLESTSRDGLEVEQVDLNSTLLEVGIEAELFPKFELLAGGTFLTAEGKDYLPVIQEFNTVRDFQEALMVDDTESLVAVGCKYNFRKDIYVTFQYQQYSYSRQATPDTDYDLNQIFVLYSMNF